MKILLCTGSLSSGGAERVMSILANTMSDQGHKVSLIHFSEKEEYYNLNENVRLIRAFNKPMNIPLVSSLFSVFYKYKKVLKQLKSGEYEIIISFLDLYSLISILAARRTNIPTVFSERANPKEKPKYWFLTFLIRKIFYKANACVLQTERVKAAFSELNIPLPATTIIPNPLDKVFFDFTDEAVKEKTILVVGSLSEVKGHSDFITAISLLVQRVNLSALGWKVLIIGEGPQRLQLEEQIKREGLSDTIQLLGRKSSIVNYYRTSEIFVLPSITEGLPNALLEAMACGCACVSFDCDYGPAEIISQNINGYLIPNREVDLLALRLETLVLDPELRVRFQRSAKIHAEAYRPENICREWLNLLKSVVN